MPKPKINSVIEKLKGANSNYQSFTTPNGMNLQLMVVDDAVSGNVMFNGDSISADYVLQAAEIIKLVAKGSSKICVFHGVLSGSRFGCDKCRRDMTNEVVAQRDLGRTVEEDEG